MMIRPETLLGPRENQRVLSIAPLHCTRGADPVYTSGPSLTTMAWRSVFILLTFTVFIVPVAPLTSLALRHSRNQLILGFEESFVFLSERAIRDFGSLQMESFVSERACFIVMSSSTVIPMILASSVSVTLWSVGQEMNSAGAGGAVVSHSIC